MTYSITRWLARFAQKNIAFRGVVNGISRARAGVRRGGLIFTDDGNLLSVVMLAKQKVPSKSQAYYMQELKEDLVLKTQFEKMRIQYNVAKYKSWEHRVDAFPGNVALYYALVRELKPSVIVETGTATGSMTSYLLAALNRNNCGRLISLDLPPVNGKLTMNLDLARSEVGYWIPEVYRDRWTYTMGDAKVTLPRTLAQERVDFFIHDSLHTRTHMLFEYSVARALMPAGSIIASDDVLWNNSFDDFLMANRLSGWAPNSNPNLAVTVNLFDQIETDIGIGIVRDE